MKPKFSSKVLILVLSKLLIATLLAACATDPDRSTPGAAAEKSEPTVAQPSAPRRKQGNDRTAKTPLLAADATVTLFVFEPNADITILNEQASSGFASGLGMQLGFIGGFVGSLIDSNIDAKRNSMLGLGGLDARLQPYRERIEALRVRDELFAVAEASAKRASWGARTNVVRKIDMEGYSDKQKLAESTGSDLVVIMYNQAYFQDGLRDLRINSAVNVYHRHQQSYLDVDERAFSYRSDREYNPQGKTPKQAELVAVRMEHWLENESARAKGAITGGAEFLTRTYDGYFGATEEILERKHRQIAARKRRTQ